MPSLEEDPQVHDARMSMLRIRRDTEQSMRLIRRSVKTFQDLYGRVFNLQDGITFSNENLTELEDAYAAFKAKLSNEVSNLPETLSA